MACKLSTFFNNHKQKSLGGDSFYQMLLSYFKDDFSHEHVWVKFQLGDEKLSGLPHK